MPQFIEKLIIYIHIVELLAHWITSLYVTYNSEVEHSEDCHRLIWSIDSFETFEVYCDCILMMSRRETVLLVVRNSVTSR